MLLGHGDLDELCSHLQVYHAYRPFSTIPREELGLYGKAAPILRTLRDDHRSDLQDKPLYPRHAVVFVTEGRYDRLHWIEAAQLLNTAALVSLPESCTPLEWLRSLDPREDPGFFGLPQSNPLRRLHAYVTAADATREQHEDTKMASEVPADSFLMARRFDTVHECPACHVALPL
ncbi:hypothetical protein Q5P01_000637 [Channa striata]|uniref:Uncharacterized protein n=1 Tax=Channa striata TaxID=64152 RepID=A0AA88IKX6_CHASR|nr:hypothetical protein Q5P01_000637 [Channa striata]